MYRSVLAVPVFLVLVACGAKDESATNANNTPAPTKTPSQETTSPHQTPGKRPPRKPMRLGGHVYTPVAHHLDHAWPQTPNPGGVDIIVYRAGGDWTGPWPLDISKFRVDHTATNVIFTLSFAEMNVKERLDSFTIQLDIVNGRHRYREIDWSLYPHFWDGRIFADYNDDAAINNCKFNATLDPASNSMRVELPNACLGNPDRLRAQAYLEAPRFHGWYGKDATPWTGYTRMGQSSTTPDPAQAPVT